MAFINMLKYICVLTLITNLKADEADVFNDSDPREVMIAQESRQYQTIVKPPVRIIKPNGVTNSHRPQYNLDSFEEEFNDSLDDFIEPTTKRSVAKDYKSSSKIRSKEGAIRDAVLKALERKDNVGRFAQILPIIRAMSGSQRVALASLVANQVNTPPGRNPLNLIQVRSMFGNNANITTDLMLPILLDMANLIRRAVRSSTDARGVKLPQTPKAQLLRRSLTVDQDDVFFDDEPFDIGVVTTTTKAPQRNRWIRPQSHTIKADDKKTEQNKTNTNSAQDNTENINNVTTKDVIDDKRSNSRSSTSTTELPESTTYRIKSTNASRHENGTLDLAADSTNQTLAQDLPVAEKLRAFNRFIDRKGNLIRRGTYPPKLSVSRRTTAEPTLSPVRRRPVPARKLPQPTANEQAKCELFTNTLCLHAEDYPTEAIVQSIRRNKAAAGALLADFRAPEEGAVDGVTAAQEAKYTAEHYLVSNRRGDTANRDFAGAGEAGFMCPSTVKYARPQRARATSGQWKYIVNTGEHTQTLRLEKCLKPKESCTYLTDNFKSKCVQVYNYHRLLTWDQQNGLHMDIFKVPTCCSCHIEGYSVSFPPVGHRVHETSSENFPGEDLSSEHGNHAFEAVQSSIQRPSVSKSPPFTLNKPLESYPPFTDHQNFVTPLSKVNDNDEFNNVPQSNAMDSYGNTYFPDSFNQASSVRNVKRPVLSRNPISNFDSATLPSYLEPPTPSGPSSFTFLKETPSKYKITNSNFKRGALRPSRRPIRKKISGAPDDLVSSGTSAIEAMETMEDFNTDLEEPDILKTTVKNIFQKKATIAPKLPVITTENIISSTTLNPEQIIHREIVSSNGKKINYNYHPIIDFFATEDVEEGDESIDRDDISYVPSTESEWKPINHPPSRKIQTTNLVERKKHK